MARSVFEIGIVSTQSNNLIFYVLQPIRLYE